MVEMRMAIKGRKIISRDEVDFQPVKWSRHRPRYGTGNTTRQEEPPRLMPIFLHNFNFLLVHSGGVGKLFVFFFPLFRGAEESSSGGCLRGIRTFGEGDIDIAFFVDTSGTSAVRESFPDLIDYRKLV